MKTLGLHMHTRVCVRRLDICVCIHEPVYAARVSKTMKNKFFWIKADVWNKSHIVWEPFQTPIFQLYKALHGIFQRATEKRIWIENIRFKRNSESKREFSTKHPQVNIFWLRHFSSFYLWVLKSTNHFCLVVN